MFNSCAWIIIIGIILLIGVIWYFNKNSDQPLPNDGVVSNIVNNSSKQIPNKFARNNINNNASDAIVDDLVLQYSDVADQYNIEPIGYTMSSDQDRNFGGYHEKKQINMRKMEQPYSDDDLDDGGFMHNKKYFTRKTPEDIKDLFDINKMMPQEIEDDWFDPLPNQSTKKIKGTHMIHPKIHMGVNTVGSSMRNASHDIRGDIPNPKMMVSPFNNTTIEPDTNIRGLCN